MDVEESWPFFPLGFDLAFEYQRKFLQSWPFGARKERRGAENAKKPLTVLAAHQRGLCGHKQQEINHPEVDGISIAPGKVLRQFLPSRDTLCTATRGKKTHRLLGFLGAACLRLDLGFHQKPGRDEGERREARSKKQEARGKKQEERCERKEWTVATEAKGGFFFNESD